MLWLTDTLSRTNAQTETQYDNVRQESRQSPFDIWPFATVVEAVIHPYEESRSQFGFAFPAAKSLQSCLTLRPHGRQPTRLPRPQNSPGKNTGVGCHFLLQCMKVKSEREIT